MTKTDIYYGRIEKANTTGFNPFLIADKYYWELSHSKIVEYLLKDNKYRFIEEFIDLLNSKVNNEDRISQ